MASCAPHRIVPGAPDFEPAVARFRLALARREALVRAASAELSVWVRGDVAGDVPGVHAWLALAGPDTIRLRVESLFGIALDCVARGDSVIAYVPAKRLGMRVEATREVPGAPSPGAVGVRLMSATWNPPPGAWNGATPRDSLLEIAWELGGDSLRLAIGAGGLPRSIELERSPGSTLRARYPEWTFVDGVAWPARVELEDTAEGLRVTLRMTRVWRDPNPSPGRLVVRIPGDAERLEWPTIRRALERARGL
jgi:hypothetical protein